MPAGRKVFLLICCVCSNGSSETIEGLGKSPYFDIGTVSSNILNETQMATFLHNYTTGFFRPFEPYYAHELPMDSRPFHIQMDILPNKRNNIKLKNPLALKRVDAMEVDFHEIKLLDQELDPTLAPLKDQERFLRSMADDPPLKVNQPILRLSLTEIFNLPRNRFTHPENMHTVGSYIYTKMGMAGLITYMQTFEISSVTTVEVEEFGFSAPGSNIVGILPGVNWNTSLDRPVIVGAHWDTVPNTPGLNDNGSGMAALLEAAEVLARAKCHKNRHTIMFVAFDMEENGCHGSKEFLRKYIIPEFINKGVKIQGAIILDTILNFNPAANSQTIEPEWHKYTPDFVQRVLANDRKGDFLAVINRQTPNEARMTQKISKYFTALGQDKFRIEPMDVESFPSDRESSIDELIEHRQFWRSDNSRFWFYKERGRPFVSLDAVLLTDTAQERGFMRQCYHQTCDSATNPQVGEDSIYFLAKTTQAVVLAVAEMSGGIEECDLNGVADNLVENLGAAAMTSSTTSTTTTSATTFTTSTTTTKSSVTTTKTTTGSVEVTSAKNQFKDEPSDQLDAISGPLLQMLATHHKDTNHGSDDIDWKEFFVQNVLRVTEAPSQSPPVFINEGSGTFQPNFGSQFNIGQLTVNMEKRTTSTPVQDFNKIFRNVLLQKKQAKEVRNSPMIIALQTD